MKMTSTNIIWYLIKVKKKSGTNPAVEIILAICSLVSLVKCVTCVLQNYCSLIICKIMLLFYA
jgi:hypothetical protein